MRNREKIDWGKTNEQRPGNCGTKTKKTNVHITGIPEEEGKEWGGKAIQRNNGSHFPNLAKDTNLESLETM